LIKMIFLKISWIATYIYYQFILLQCCHLLVPCWTIVASATDYGAISGQSSHFPHFWTVTLRPISEQSKNSNSLYLYNNSGVCRSHKKRQKFLELTDSSTTRIINKIKSYNHIAR
jgi:hypothetical protein